jgi:cell division protein FtsW (lipid II flippase)
VLLLRVLGLLVAAALGTCVLMYLLTGERKYLRYAWQTFRYALFLFVLILLLFFGERLLVLA